MLHRDIKSGNVLLDKHFSSLLADFGLSKARQTASTMSRTANAAGTLHYIAPEIFGMSPKFSTKSDVGAIDLLEEDTCIKDKLKGNGKGREGTSMNEKGRKRKGRKGKETGGKESEGNENGRKERT